MDRGYGTKSSVNSHSLIGGFVSSPSTCSIASSSTSSGFTSDASERSTASGESLLERRARRRAEKEVFCDSSSPAYQYHQLVHPLHQSYGEKEILTDVKEQQLHLTQQFFQQRSPPHQHQHQSGQHQSHHHHKHQNHQGGSHSSATRDQDTANHNNHHHHHQNHHHNHHHHQHHNIHHPTLGEIAAMNRSAHEPRHHDDLHDPSSPKFDAISCGGGSSGHVTSGHVTSPGSRHFAFSAASGSAGSGGNSKMSASASHLASSGHVVSSSGYSSSGGSHVICGGSHATSGSGHSASSVSMQQAMAHMTISPKPRKRTTSLKKPSRKYLENTELDDIRPRTSSLPTRNNIKRPNLQYLSPPPFSTYRDNDDVYTIRSFVTTSKGQLVNRGDSFRSKSTNSIMSSNSGSFTELTHLSNASSQCSLSQGSGGNSCGPESPAPVLPYKVLMLGSPGVGKSSLTEQFSTSEYLGTFGPSIDSYREKSVSLLIDGEESTVDFIDPAEESDALNDLSIDGFVVVFRIDDRSTFAHATDLLYDMRKTRGLNSAVILVANKCDLVRSREVSTEEAKSVAATYDCKYIETSVVLNHNVDELLVGIVTQMRLISQKKGGRKAKHSGDEMSCYARSKHLLSKIFRKYPISKSCENLYVL